jgi:Uma2 family endonuclease
MSIISGKKLLTAAEFEALESEYLESSERVELIEGEVVTMSPIGTQHAGLGNFIHDLLYRRLGTRALIRDQWPVRLSEITEPQPDLAIVPYRDDYYQKAHPGPHEILCLIEIADSSLAYDRGRKARVYAAAGLRDYIVVNLQDEVLEVYREPSSQGYASVTLLRRGDRLALLAFPDIQFGAAELLPWQDRPASF